MSDAGAPPLLEARGIVKRFGDLLANDVSHFSVGAGEDLPGRCSICICGASPVSAPGPCFSKSMKATPPRVRCIAAPASATSGGARAIIKAGLRRWYCAVISADASGRLKKRPVLGMLGRGMS